MMKRPLVGIGLILGVLSLVVAVREEGATETGFMNLTAESGVSGLVCDGEEGGNCRTDIVLAQYPPTYYYPPPTPPPTSCFQLNILTTNYSTAPATLSFRLQGENSLPSYRIDYGDGAVEVNGTGYFTHTYVNPGNYTIQGYVQSPQGYWVNGSFCMRMISLTAAVAGLPAAYTSPSPYITPVVTPVPTGTVPPMVTQPATGADAWLWGGTLIAGTTALVLGVRKRFG